jgi:23S rRNA pseudouridine1911/1915/1917 synthase
VIPQQNRIKICVPEKLPEQTRVDTYVAEHAKLFSRSQFKRRVVSLLVNGKAVKPSKHLHRGDTLEIVFNDEPQLKVEAESIALDVLFEDANVLVVNKAQGMVVHPASGNWSGTLVNAIIGHCSAIKNSFAPGEARPGIVHRLDKDTSGVIITAKNPESREFLSQQFRKRRVGKRYVAVVQGEPPRSKDRIDTWIGRDPHNRKRFTSLVSDNTGKRAVTDYRAIRKFGSYTLVSLRPRTGRTHQLRVHMAHLGCPIVGDRLYGWKARGASARTLMLHAHTLRLLIPGEQLPRTFRAPLPDRFRSFFDTN